MRIHEIKCRNFYFEDVIAGNKNFTVRKNDRGYEVGDILAVNDVSDLDGAYTGRCCLLKITYILDDPDYCKEGFVILGFRPCQIRVVDDQFSFVNDRRTYEVQAYTEVPR